MSEITVASTTDTQEAIDQAAGVGPEAAAAAAEEASEQEQPGAGPASRDQAESAAAAGAAEEEGDRSQVTGDRENQQHRKSGVQKRIDTLTRRLYEQQDELDALKRARPEATGQRPQQTQQPRPRPTPQDKRADGKTPRYASYEQYVEDLAEWKAEQKLLQNRQAELNQAEQERTQEVFHTYNEAAKTARVKYEDFEEVVGRRDVHIPQAAQVAIIEAGDAGPEIAYYLGKHPEVCAELVEMSPMRAVARIGSIEAELAAARPSRSSQSMSSPSSSSRTVSSKSKPAPITPVGGSSSKSAVPLGELPYRDYKRIRDKEERENRYR
jgi:hypothetical protein